MPPTGPISLPQKRPAKRFRGHGGVLDRIDWLLFAAPIFVHVTRFFF